MKDRSISIPMLAMLVFWATLILIIYAMIMAWIYRNKAVKHLEAHMAVQAEQLQTAMAGVLWNYDTALLDKILDGTMKNKIFTGVRVDSSSNVFSRKRNAAWESVPGLPESNSAGEISCERSISYLGEDLGTMTLWATTRFVHRDIFMGISYFLGGVLLLDGVLVFSLYGTFSRIVIDPLRTLQAYALALSRGENIDTAANPSRFRGEMEVLRRSLEGMFKDIQNQVKRVKDSEERFRILVNTIPDLIWLKDPKGVYLTCNKMFERFFGAREEEIAGKTDYDFVEKDLADYFRAHDRKAMEYGKPRSNEEWITFADDGRKALLDTTKAPMFDTDGHLIGVLGVARDITSRRQAEREKMELKEQLNQAQKIESVGRLAGGVAHDFNNMLGVILGHAELALEDGVTAPELREHISEITQAANRSADLTRQLLAFARKEAISPRPLDLNATVDGMCKMLRRLIGENIDLTWSPGTGLWPVKMDPSQLDHILANLCINARDAMPDGGKIAIETENISVEPSYCETHPEAREGDFVMLRVVDSGCGIPKELMDHIFEPFFTTKETGKGTGLGLATVYGVVKQNQGFITVYSEESSGTAFHIYLPRHEGRMEPGTVSSEESEPEGGHETVLLVEDEPSMLRMVSRTLEKKGYTVLASPSPKQAIQLSLTHKGKIDLLLTDVIMPEMNGRELADTVKDYRPDIKILFMSGYTADVIVHHGVMDKGVRFIQKPFSNKDLVEKIRSMFD